MKEESFCPLLPNPSTSVRAGQTGSAPPPPLSSLFGQVAGGACQPLQFANYSENLQWRLFLFFAGYEWVGWKNRSMGPLQLDFTFDAVRVFQKMAIHINNHYSRDIQIFARAKAGVYILVRNPYLPPPFPTPFSLGIYSILTSIFFYFSSFFLFFLIFFFFSFHIPIYGLQRQGLLF
jgi:hypothetical protein